MKRNTLRMSLLAAAMAATFGIARADTVTSVTVPSDRLEPKCTDTANTQPAGCVPSAPIARSSSSTTTKDVAPGIAVVPGASSSSTDVKLNGKAASASPGSSTSSSSTDIDLNGSVAAKQYPTSPNTPASSGSSSTSSTLNVSPSVGVDANASVDNSNANIGTGVSIGNGSSTPKPDTGTSSTQ